MQWFAQAPSNIALIKYMGKQNSALNLPSNASLSYTLKPLQSQVELEHQPGTTDRWEPLATSAYPLLELSSAAQARFLSHLQFLKQQFNYSGAFTVRSNNNFPHSSGLASSASSFAALTRCALTALSELTQTPLPSVEQQAQLSRLGSGSSCRSFFAPWALWDKDTVTPLPLPYPELIHQVIVISAEQKKISSRDAHQHVNTSPLYPARAAHAQHNLEQLIAALTQQDWGNAYAVCWREFQEMHQLFETAAVPFSYFTPRTHQALHALQALWQRHADGPLVTMDAGPNIHLLYRPEQTDLAQQFKQDYLSKHYEIL